MNRKQGMFAHAKYSEKIFRNVPPKVAEGVKRDIAYILKKDNPIDINKWNRALPSQSSNVDNDYEIPGSLTRLEPRQQARQPRKYVKPKPADLRNEFFSAKELLHKESHSTDESRIPSKVMKHRDSYQSTRVEETPTAFRSPESKRRKRAAAEAVTEERIFPPNVNPYALAERVKKSLPHLPLRRSDNVSYKEAVTEILKNAVTNFIPSEVPIRSSRVIDENVDPLQGLMNITGPLNLSRSSDGKQSQANESPVNVKELSHIRNSCVNFVYEDDGDILAQLERNILTPQIIKVPERKTVRSEYDSAIPSQYDGFITPEQFVTNLSVQNEDEESPEDSNIPTQYNNEIRSGLKTFTLDRSALRTPLSCLPSQFQNQYHQSTLRTPSISDTFNNLGHNELHFKSPHSVKPSLKRKAEESHESTDIFFKF